MKTFGDVNIAFFISAKAGDEWSASHREHFNLGGRTPPRPYPLNMKLIGSIGGPDAVTKDKSESDSSFMVTRPVGLSLCSQISPATADLIIKLIKFSHHDCLDKLH